jgi:hypothetical protein
VFNGRLFAASSHHSGETFQLWWTDNGVTWNKHADDGFGDVNNLGVLAMVIFDGYLYAGTVNDTAGAQIWRTDNGIDWTPVANDGILNPSNDAVTCLAVHDGALFAGTENQPGGGQIYRTTNGTSWLPVMIGGFGNVSNRAVASLQSYGGRLYAGTYKDSTLLNQGAEIYWADSFTGTVTWDGAATPGFGDNYNMAFPSMTVYNGQLYVGTTQLNALFGTGCEVWRWTGSLTMGTWQMVGNGGFGSVMSASATRFYHYNGKLLVGVEDPGGAKLMQFEDILSWDPLVSDGFGDNDNIGVLGGTVFDSNLFIGTTNTTDGCEVHREVTTIFYDDFEFGDTLDWSSTVP